MNRLLLHRNEPSTHWWRQPQIMTRMPCIRFSVPAGHDLISPDVVQATEEYKMFVQHLTEKTELTTNSDSNVTLEIGRGRLAVSHSAGETGRPMVLRYRRRQRKKFSPAASAGTKSARSMFAMRMWMPSANMPVRIAWATACWPTRSSCAARPARTTDFSGRRIKPGEGLSPLGPLIAQARVDGYHRTAKMLNDEQAPYHGYYFKILTRQGRHAPGGKYNYIINGRMIAGFASSRGQPNGATRA
jgi:hypothetical protein